MLCVTACSGAVAPNGRAQSSATPAPATANRETIRPGLAVASVGRDAWVVTHEDVHDSNVLVVRLPERTMLLCSSPFDSDTTAALVGWVRARFAPARMIAINTHWHLDGTGGNAVYRAMGVETYASRHTQTLSLARGASMRREAADGLPGPVAEHVRATPVVGAEHTFDESTGLTLAIGGERVEVIYPGAAHSQDNVVVYLPARRILLGGCMLKVGESIGYLGDASLDTWERAIARVAALGAEIVVPGHGPAGGPEILENTVRLVRTARASAP